MSTHPNAILGARLTPDGLSRATYRALLNDFGADADDPSFEVDGQRFHVTVMEGDYDESWQLSASEGDIVVHTFLTYGYGDRLSWGEVQRRAETLEALVSSRAERLHYSFELFVTANYW